MSTNGKSFFLGVLILICLNLGLGQEPPKAILIDEHGEIPCDDTLGRIDAFFSELVRSPQAKGLIIISNSPARKVRSVWRQHLIETHTRWRNLDASRFRIVRASFGEELKIRFWIIPRGGDEPDVENSDMSYTLPPAIAPFMLASETKFGEQICPDVDDARIFADFLKANPAARGNIVVRDNSKLRAVRQAARIVRTFEVKYGIRRSRIRTFIRRVQRPASHDEDVVEYWYLP